MAPKRYRSFESKRKHNLKYQHGISVEFYDELLIQQNNVCAICKQECSRGSLCVDHDHDTQKIRGLLCRSCNLGLGNFRDNLQYLENAIEYLKCL